MAGYSRMRLDTSKRQEEAMRLYERSAFRRIEPYYELPDDLRNWLVFFRTGTLNDNGSIVMPSPLSSTKALAKLAQVATKLNALSLPAKIMELRHSRSEDRIQQLQSEAIVELYDAVKQLQEAIWPMLVLIPDVEAVRQAAQAAGSAASAPALSSAAARLVPGSRFTR